jgi:hypothetical protein
MRKYNYLIFFLVAQPASASMIVTGARDHCSLSQLYNAKHFNCLAEVLKISFIVSVEQVIAVELIDNKKPLECHQRL